jgi:hypothetical protein
VGHDHLQASTDTLRLGSLLTYPNRLNSVLSEVTFNTIFVGSGGEGRAAAIIQLGTVVQGTPPMKCVIEANIGGQTVIVKYWPVEQEER